jgi:hypothetical protein
MYKVGDKVEVMTTMYAPGIGITQTMEITKVYESNNPFEKGAKIYRYACNGNNYIHYGEGRIIRKVEV